jgi:hypothetical protein
VYPDKLLDDIAVGIEKVETLDRGFNVDSDRACHHLHRP